MKKVCFIILVSFYFVKSYGMPTNVILALMEEFNIINPTILHNNSILLASIFDMM